MTETTLAQRLYETLSLLPLTTLTGLPASAFSGTAETVVFNLPRTFSTDGALTLEAQAVMLQANALLAAAAAAGRSIEVVVIVADVAAGEAAVAQVTTLRAEQMPGVRTLIRQPLPADEGTVQTAMVDAIMAFEEAFGAVTGLNFDPVGGWTAMHRPEGASEVHVATTGERLNEQSAVAFQQFHVIDTELEALLASTGPALDLPSVTFPGFNITTDTGAFDAVGEMIPALTLTDANGNPLALLGGEGLLVLSICAVWCGPCFAYSQDLNQVAAAVGDDFRFVEFLMQDGSTDVATTSDALAWAQRFGLEAPVVTTDGDANTLLNIVRGFDLQAIPDYIVIDSATGRIVDRFGGFGDAQTLIGQLSDIADAFYADLPGLDLVGSNKADVLEGSRSADTLLGGAGDDTLHGNRGNDLLDGGRHRDVLVGGDGDDTYRIQDGRLDQETIIETATGGSDTVLVAGTTGNADVRLGATLAEHIERLAIADGIDPVWFVEAGDVTNAWNFHFAIDSSSASRIAGIRGGALDDVIDVALQVGTPEAGSVPLEPAGPVTLEVRGGQGNDTLTVASSDELTPDNSFVAFRVLGGVGNDRLFGSTGNDDLRGGDGTDELVGNAGDDRLDGGTGADIMRGGAGGDSYTVDDIGDTIEGEITAGDGGNTAAIVTTLDQIEAGFGFFGMTLDEFSADPGREPLQNADQIISLEDSPFFGFDWTTLQSLFMGVFDGSIPVVNEGDAFIIGGDASTGDVGIDLVQSRISFDLANASGIENLTLMGNASLNGLGNAQGNLLTGNRGNNQLDGRDGDDVLFGLAGRDTLSGGQGFDLLDGGAGNDVLTGGLGADTYVFTGHFGQDRITDFDPTEDRFQFRDVDQISFEGLMARAKQVEGNVVFSFAGGDVLTLVGIQLADLSASNF